MSFLYRDRSFLCNLYKSFARPVLDYGSVIWNPESSDVGIIDLLESVQRNFTCRLPGIENEEYEERLRILNLETLELRRLKNDLLYAFKILKGFVNLDTENLFTMSHNSLTRGHKFKFYISSDNFKKCRHQFFSNRIIKVWNALPANVINCNSINQFKLLLDKVNFSSIFEV